MKAKSERRRPFIGEQINECRDISGLFYILCFQKGYLINWDIQKTVWDYMFSPDCCNVNLSESSIIITEPQFNFHSIQEAMTEIFFEEYDCENFMKTTSADLCTYNYIKSNPKTLGCIVIDMGYSFTHIVPFVKGKRIKAAIRRVEIGGKVLTNNLKEIISYRQLNVMDETYVINQAKEDACFVSQNFNEDMKQAKSKIGENKIVKDYVLPDFTSIRRGFVREPQPVDENEELQTLRLNNERFVIPEILFHPSDVGIQQMGIAEAVLNCIEFCPEEAVPHLLANIIVSGGCGLFPGMQTRLQNEIRALAPDEFDVNVFIPPK